MSSYVARRLVTSCIHHMFIQHDQQDTYHHSLQTEFARFKLWNQGFDGPWDDSVGSSSSRLDDVLTYSIYFRETTISILATVVGCLLMKEFQHVGDQQTRAAMQRALDDAMVIYPHIANTGWDSDSDDTPESATEQLHDIINSLFQLAPALDVQLKKLECATPAIDRITRSHKGLVAERFTDAPAHNSDSGLPTIDLPPIGDQTDSECLEVTPREPPQRQLRFWAGQVSGPPCSTVDQSPSQSTLDQRPPQPGLDQRPPPQRQVRFWAGQVSRPPCSALDQSPSQSAFDQSPPQPGLDQHPPDIRFNRTIDPAGMSNEPITLSPIMLYVSSATVKLTKSGKLLGGHVSSDLHNTIVGTISREAVDSFMWATMQLDRICKFETESQIRAHLSRYVLPSSLDDTYQKLWTATKDTEWTGWVHDMLAWIIFSLSPLSAPTIFHATAIHRFNTDSNLVAPSTASLDRFFAGFVQMDSNSDSLLAIHPTARRFLRKQPEFGNANDMIANTCLIVLRGGDDSQFRGSDIHSYATLNWQDHVRAWTYIDASRSALLNCVLNTAQYTRKLASFRQMLDPQVLNNVPAAKLLADIISDSTSTVAQQKQVIPAICFGLPVVLRYFLQQMPNVRSPRWLALAVSLGDLSICRILVQAGIDVNTFAPGEGAKGCGSALHIAAAAGHETIVELLLSNHADANGQDEEQTFALHRAAAAGHEIIVELLIEYGANWDCMDSKGYTAIQLANHAGHMDVVHLLQNYVNGSMNDQNRGVESGSGPGQLSRRGEREHSTTLPDMPTLHRCPMPDCPRGDGFLMRSDLLLHLRLVHPNRSGRHEPQIRNG